MKNMENENLKPIEKLTPFTKMIMTIGALPSSFYSSMSYYEAMVWLYEYLKNTIIPAVNNNGEAVIELQEKFIELKTWVHEYEETQLPIEVVKKLDEMAEDGTLMNLIAEYINENIQLVFNNVQEMKNSTIITNGAFVKTYGYYTYNDGGGCLYKITNTESENEYQEELENGLYANLITNNYITPEMFGAKGDYTTDDSVAIQNAFDYASRKGKTLYFQKNYYMSSGIKVKSKTTMGDVDTLINITGNANPEWNFQNRNDRTSKIKVDDHFMSTDEIINTSDINTVAQLCADIGYLTINSDDQNEDYYLFNGILLNESNIHNITSQGFAGIIYGAITKVTHIHHNIFLSCHGVCFKTFETVVVLFTDSYVHDNYINGGSSTTQGNLFAYGNAHSFYIYNNYIDFFNYIYKCSGAQATFNFIHSSNNVYDTFISLNAKRDGEHSWYDEFTGFRNCFFTNDKFASNEGSYSSYLPDEQRCIFDISSYNTNGLSITNCEITDPHPCLLYSSNNLYYPNETDANYKRIILSGNQCTSFISNQFEQLIQCKPNNERGQYTLITDMIDSVAELPTGNQFNGRKVIYNGDLYEYYGSWKTIYNA